MEFVGDGARFGLDVRVLHRGRPCWATPARWWARLDTLPEQFLVLYGDVMTAVDLRPAGANSTLAAGRTSLCSCTRTIIRWTPT